MPTLRFSGLSVSMLRVVAQEVTPTLAQVVGCPANWFHFQALTSTTVSHDGTEVARPPVYIDLVWFSRGQTVQDKVAATVTEAVKKALKTEAKEGEGEIVDVTVVARTVEKQDYYENGSHF